MTALAAVLLEWPYPHVDPVLVHVAGPLDVRWYGLGYLAGFAVAWLVLRRLARSGFLRVSEEAVGDLIFALVLGVILGGRIGYILFYSLPSTLSNPSEALKIWQGGLSFHGGLLGVMAAAWWFTRKHKVGWLHLCDGLSLAVPFGIFFVRIANFVNGELFGRVAPASVPWAMRFPTDPVAQHLLGADTVQAIRGREQIVNAAYRSGLWDQIRGQVPLRHPSQLYEAGMEGLLLGLVLWTVYLWTRRTGRTLGTGAYCGIFALGYGIVRIIGELFRQPDAQFRSATNPLGTVLGPLTMGQTLSSVMVIGGIFLLVRAHRRGPDQPHAPSPADAAAV
ncbi:MAG: Prolipoprotein diacylglyceryl transferase [Gemmatimonadetes bacterium]|nr:Prolipoprotein diacylglyceryl transferase [Gemmatimonadota bacterium]